MIETDAYNVLTENCQTFARKLAAELGKPVIDLNDGTKAFIGSAVVVSSGLILAASGGPRQSKLDD